MLKIFMPHQELQKADSDRCLMLFDLAVGGHHSTYIRYLVEAWCERVDLGRLEIVVSPLFFELHDDVVQLAVKNGHCAINFSAISASEFSELKQQKSFLAKTATQWNLFCKYASALRATQGLLMYFDHLQLSLIFGKKTPCPVAGIYFRPTFHYSQFSGYRSNRSDRIRQWRQKFLLRLVLQNPQLNALFCLDPFAVEPISKLSKRAKIIRLADPVREHQIEQFGADELKKELGIEDDRQVFLLFGRLDDRKGVFQLLESVQKLPQALCQTLCLLLVGSISPTHKSRMNRLITEVSQTSPVQIVVQDQFVPEADVQRYMQLATVVLAPYQRHVGMSGILLLAAAAQKPVLSSNYGLMGELVKQYQLGLAIDTESSSEIAHAIAAFLKRSDDVTFSLEKMQQFVEQNTADEFTKTIFDQFSESPNYHLP